MLHIQMVGGGHFKRGIIKPGKKNLQSDEQHVSLTHMRKKYITLNA